MTERIQINQKDPYESSFEVISKEPPFIEKDGKKWQKLTLSSKEEHSCVWKTLKGFAAFFATLGTLIIGAFLINSIRNLWKEALSGRKIIQIEKEIAPQEQTKANHLAVSQLKTKMESQPKEIKSLVVSTSPTIEQPIKVDTNNEDVVLTPPKNIEIPQDLQPQQPLAPIIQKSPEALTAINHIKQKLSPDNLLADEDFLYEFLDCIHSEADIHNDIYFMIEKIKVLYETSQDGTIEHLDEFLNVLKSEKIRTSITNSNLRAFVKFAVELEQLDPQSPLKRSDIWLNVKIDQLIDSYFSLTTSLTTSRGNLETFANVYEHSEEKKKQLLNLVNLLKKFDLISADNPLRTNDVFKKLFNLNYIKSNNSLNQFEDAIIYKLFNEVIKETFIRELINLVENQDHSTVLLNDFSRCKERRNAISYINNLMSYSNFKNLFDGDINAFIDNCLLEALNTKENEVEDFIDFFEEGLSAFFTEEALKPFEIVKKQIRLLVSMHNKLSKSGLKSRHVLIPFVIFNFDPTVNNKNNLLEKIKTFFPVKNIQLLNEFLNFMEDLKLKADIQASILDQ